MQGAVAWATAPVDGLIARNFMVEPAPRGAGFCPLLHGIDPSVEVPPVDLLTWRQPSRTFPTCTRQSDLARLMADGRVVATGAARGGPTRCFSVFLGTARHAGG